MSAPTPEQEMTLDEAIEEHLDRRGATLYGQAFDLFSPSRREEARVWLRRQIEGVADVLAGN